MKAEYVVSSSLTILPPLSSNVTKAAYSFVHSTPKDVSVRDIAYFTALPLAASCITLWIVSFACVKSSLSLEEYALMMFQKTHLVVCGYLHQFGQGSLYLGPRSGRMAWREG